MAQAEELAPIFYPTDTIASAADIAFGLLPLIQSCTSTRFPQELIKYVGEIAKKRPKDIETICKAISLLSNNSEIWNKQLDMAPNPDPYTRFGHYLCVSLGEKISDGLDDVHWDDENGNLSIDSNNIRLTTALLSASAIKHDIQYFERIPLGIIQMGLQDPYPGLPDEPEKNEVFGVVAIIHLAIVGDKYRDLNLPGEGAEKALKGLKEKGVFKLPSSMTLLEHAIRNAESGYKNNISENETWDLLFPAIEG